MSDEVEPPVPQPEQLAQELAFFVGDAPLLMGTVALGPDGDIIHLYDNAATCRFFGMPYGVTGGRSARSMGVPEEIIRLWRERYDQAVAAGGAIKFEYNHPGDDGERTLAVTVSPLSIRSPHGVCCGYIADDVTEERRARQELFASNERFQAAVRAVEGILWTNDPDGRMAGDQPGWASLTGQTRAEYEGYGWSKAVHPDDASATVQAWQQAVADRKPFVFEHRVCRFDGEWRTFAIRAIPVIGADDEVQEWVGVHTDVTDQRRTREDLLASETRLRESEEQLRLATEAAEVGLWDVDPQSDTLFWPPRVKAMFGISPDAPVSMSADFFPCLHPEDAAKVRAAYEAAVDPTRRALYDVEYRTVGKEDGVIRWVAAKGRGLFDSEGRCYRVIGTAMDISRRKEAEQALHAQARSLEVLNATGVALASELDLEKIVQMVTDAAVKLIGAEFGAFFYNIVDEGGERYTLYTISGVPREHFSKFPMPRNTEVFAPTFEGAGIVRSDDITKDSRYGKSAPHYGMPPGHLPVRSYLAAPVRSRDGEVLGGLFFGHSKVGVFSALDENSVAGLCAQAAIAIDNARLFQASQWELSARRRAEEELKALNETLEQEVHARTRERDMVWTTSQDLFAIIGRDECYISLNPAWTSSLGYALDELIGMHGSTLVHPDDLVARAADFDPLQKGEAVRDVDLRIRGKDGDYKWFSWTAIPTGDGQVYCEGRDVTERRQLEDLLRQAQKMEAVGQLTGGIAHDFNNLLTGISGSLELLEKRLPDDANPNLHRYLNAAATSANRAAALTHRLLAFSRRQPLDPKPVDANQLIASMDDLLRRTIGENIQLNMVNGSGLWRTLCDPHQLESAVLNLAINARDAMPSGGKLTVETCNVDFDAAAAARLGDVKPGQYICVCVTDTGVGMAPDVIEKAFEPFFTTKPIGQGTGLGLSMIYGFTRQSEGHAKIYSEVGKGTSVKLYLPRYHGTAADHDQPGSSTPLEAHRAPGRETVLVVEDEQSVRELVVEILTNLNYRTIEATDGPSGLNALEEAAVIDLLITDVGLPGLNGRQLADAARIRRPDLKVMFMTGYAENAAVSHGFLDPGMEIITKPFSLETFASRVRRMIEGDQSKDKRAAPESH